MRILARRGRKSEGWTIGLAIRLAKALPGQVKDGWHNTSGATGPLTELERRDVHALAAILYPPDNDREARELAEVVEDWIRLRTEEDGWLSVYREGLRRLDRHVRRQGRLRAFHELGQLERQWVLEQLVPVGKPWQVRHASSPRELAEVIWFRLLGRHEWRLRRYQMEDLLTGIYKSPLGWRLWSYRSRPGVEGDPLEFTRRPEW